MSSELSDLSSRQRAEGSYRATLLSQAVRIACKAISVVVVARLVSPEEHGLFAMAASFVLVLLLFRDFGFGAAAIQAPMLTEEQKTAAWWLHVAAGILLSGVTVAAAFPVARIYAEPRVTHIVIALSGGVLLVCLNSWPRTLLAREVRFADLSRAEIAAAISATLAMIAAAALGAGAYAFVIFLVVSEGFMLVAAWHICAWRPAGEPAWSSLRRLARGSTEITTYNVLLYCLQQLDTFFVGRWFGAASLGYYSRPNQLLALPAGHLAGPLANVLLAALSRSAPDAAHFREQFRQTTNLIAHLTLPFAAVCIALPAEIVFVVFGAEWAASAPILRWLAVSAAAAFLTSTTYPLCVATGHTRRLMTMTSVTLVVVAAVLWLHRHAGPVGLAQALAWANLALLLPRMSWAAFRTPVGAAEIWNAVARPIVLSGTLASTMMITAAVVVDSLVSRLVIGVGAGLVAAILLAALWPGLRRELWNVWRHRPGGGPFVVSVPPEADA